MKQQRSTLYWFKACALSALMLALVAASLALSFAIAQREASHRGAIRKRERVAAAGGRAAQAKLDSEVSKLKEQSKQTTLAKLNLASFQTKNAKAISDAKAASSQAQDCDLQGVLLYTVVSASSVGVPCDVVKGLFNRDRLASNAELGWVGDQPNLRTAGYACDTVKTESYATDHTVRVSCTKGSSISIDVVYDSSQVDTGGGSNG